MDGELVLTPWTWHVADMANRCGEAASGDAVKGWIEQGLNQGMGEPWVISPGKIWENMGN